MGVDRDRLDCIVEDSDPYLEIVTKCPAALQVLGKAVKARQRVARKDAAEMTNDVAFVIILGGPDQDNGQAFARNSPCGGLLCHGFRSSTLCVGCRMDTGRAGPR